MKQQRPRCTAILPRKAAFNSWSVSRIPWDAQHAMMRPPLTASSARGGVFDDENCLSPDDCRNLLTRSVLVFVVHGAVFASSKDETGRLRQTHREDSEAASEPQGWPIKRQRPCVVAYRIGSVCNYCRNPSRDMFYILYMTHTQLSSEILVYTP